MFAFTSGTLLGIDGMSNFCRGAVAIALVNYTLMMCLFPVVLVMDIRRTKKNAGASKFLCCRTRGGDITRETPQKPACGCCDGCISRYSECLSKATVRLPV